MRSTKLKLKNKIKCNFWNIYWKCTSFSMHKTMITVIIIINYITVTPDLGGSLTVCQSALKLMLPKGFRMLTSSVLTLFTQGNAFSQPCMWLITSSFWNVFSLSCVPTQPTDTETATPPSGATGPDTKPCVQQRAETLEPFSNPLPWPVDLSIYQPEPPRQPPTSADHPFSNLTSQRSAKQQVNTVQPGKGELYCPGVDGG